MRKEKGITLIAVVVTIIVLLIVAMITMTFVIGENGLFSRSNKASEHHKIEGYKDVLEVLRGVSEIEKGVNGISSKEYMDIYEEETKKDKNLEEATIKRKSEDTVRVITKEGYIFDITEKETKYIGKQDDLPPPPDLKKGDIKFNYNPSEWTNENVKVGIEIAKEEIKNAGYTLEYSRDGKEWKVYTEELEFEENGAIHARLINTLDVTGGIATGNVANIDKVAPKEFTAEATVTTNSITVNGSTEDEPKTETNGCSGIARYEYSINNGAWQASNVFNSLIQNTKYTIKMKAIDNAGNETETENVEVTTKTVAVATGNITISAPTWNASTHKATVTISKGSAVSSELRIQYQVNGYEEEKWTEGTTVGNLNNKDVVYARLWDGRNAGSYATSTIIDGTKPSAGISAGAVNNKTVTLTATGSDAQSGVASYKFYVGGSLKTTVTSEQGSATYNYTTTFGSINAYVEVTDKAGNISKSNTITINDYTIKTLAELKVFRDSVNNGTAYSGITIKQIASITMDTASWIPIGNVNRKFNGIYDGQNNTISNMKISSGTAGIGLFGYINSNSNIKNLTISNPNINVQGKIVGAAVGDNSGTIENVKVVGGTIIGTMHVGGVCGKSGGTIKLCSNSATVKYTNSGEFLGWSVGGIVGYAVGTITQCMNTGNITGTHTVGGIVGEGSTTTINSCVNKGTVKSDKDSDSAIAGGIIGMSTYTGTTTIENCYNTGTISSVIYSGGIAGEAGNTNSKTTIRNCYSIGTIQGPNKGGIVDSEFVIGNLVVSNNYWLTGCGATYGRQMQATNTSAMPKTSAELKALAGTLGSAYKADSKNINGGYPILNWQ